MLRQGLFSTLSSSALTFKKNILYLFFFFHLCYVIHMINYIFYMFLFLCRSLERFRNYITFSVFYPFTVQLKQILSSVLHIPFHKCGIFFFWQMQLCFSHKLKVEIGALLMVLAWSPAADEGHLHQRERCQEPYIYLVPNFNALSWDG